MNKDLKNVVYSSGSIEFVTVAVQYCVLLESATDQQKGELIDKLTKILPLLYLKATMIPQLALDNEDEMPEISVTEEMYNYIASSMMEKLAGDDPYLEVFVQDMKYSDTPITESISENLADIYQDLKNCITVYERGVTELMNDALFVCFDNFKTYWGQKLVNVLRALHTLKYAEQELGENIDTEEDADIW